MEYLTREKMEEELKKAEEAQTEQEAQPEEAQPEQAEEIPEQTQALQQEAVKEDRLASLEKALKDTKAWATRLAQENAELKKAIEELRAGTGTQQQVNEAYLAVQKAEATFNEARQRLYEDYPEFRDIIEPLFEKSHTLEKKIAEIEALKSKIEEQSMKQAAIEYFNTYVKPEILKVHPDFDEIIFKEEGGAKVANDEFFNWAVQQSPALQYAALQSSDPRDIIWAITEYKKYKHTPEALAEKAKIERHRQKKLSAQMAMKSANTAIPPFGSQSLSEEDIPVDEWMKKRNKEVYGR